MKVNFLTTKQVDYELQIRNIKTIKKDLNTKKKMLKKLLDKERENKKVWPDPEFNFDNEKVQINEAVENIRLLIEEFEGPETDSGFSRIQTNLIHLTHRINRIDIESLEIGVREYVTNYKLEAQATCLELEALFSEKIRYPVLSENIQPNLNSTVLLNTTLGNHSLSNNSQKSVPVYKWNLKFNGSSSSSIKSFLERIEELCESRNMSKIELFKSASDLFEGPALIWFRSVKKSIHDWDSLVNLLIKEFLPSDYEDKLWTEIRERTQGRNESIIIYVAIMESLFNRLSNPVQEVTKLKYIKKNMLPHYISQLALTSVNSILELTNYCRKIDEATVQKNKYHAPPSHCSIEPELAYINNDESHYSNYKNKKNFYNKNKTKFIHKKKETNSGSQNISTLDSSGPSTSGSSTNKRSKCWNCNIDNHNFRYCNAPRRRFCYNCGKPNETIKTCPCSKNE